MGRRPRTDVPLGHQRRHPGAGGANPAGNWDGVGTNFNTDSAGAAGTLAASPSATATVVSLAAGALFANVVSVVIMVVETTVQRR